MLSIKLLDLKSIETDDVYCDIEKGGFHRLELGN